MYTWSQTISSNTTTLIADSASREEIDIRVSQLKKELENSDSIYDTQKLSERIAKLEAIAKFAIEKDLLVASDEIYSELTFEGDHVSIASLPGMRERTVFLHGFSKAFAMTGFRIGYACGPAAVIDGMLKVHQYGIMCASIISQEAAVEALRKSRRFTRSGRHIERQFSAATKMMRKRRD